MTKMGFLDFFVRDVETSDFHTNPNLRTHYYRSDYRQTKETIISYFKSKNLQVKHIDDTYGEILVEASSFHLIFSIRKAGVINSSVDIKVSVYNFLPAGRPFKLIKEIYAYLDKALPMTGVGVQGS